MLIARTAAVYALAGFSALWLANRYVGRVRRTVGLCLLAAPLLITGRALLTGGVYAPIDIAYQAEPLASLRDDVGIGKSRSPILGDVVSQEIPWRKAVREAVKNGRLPLWNRFILAGEPLLAVQQPAVLHPATWFGMLLPLPQAWTFEMTFTLFVALLSAYLFFKDLGLSDLAAGIGAAGWAFCDYVGFFLGYPLSPAVAPFPLVLLGLSLLARERSLRAVFVTSAALCLVVVAGHSETVLHVVAAAGIFFLFRLASESGSNRIRAVLLSLVAGAATLGLTAVILLPHAEALPYTFEYFFRNAWYAHAPRSVPVAQALEKLQQFAIPFSFGVSGQGSMTDKQGPSFAYVGSLLFPLAVVGLSSARRVKWVFLLLLFLGLSMWTTLPVVNDLVCRLPLFDIAINERLVFLAAFAVAALAALGAEEIEDGRARRLFPAALVISLLLLGWGCLLLRSRLRALEMPPSFLAGQAAFLLIPIALALAWWALRGRALPRAAVAGVLALFLCQRAAESVHLYPVAPNRAFYPPMRFLDVIPRGAPYRTTAVGFTFIPNISALYELEDPRGYEAMTFLPLFDTYSLWCVHQPVWFNRIDDPTRPFLSLLNVRYFLLPEEMTIPPGWRQLSKDNGVRVVENPNALARLFVPAEIRTETDRARRLAVMSQISDFARQGVVGTANPLPPPGAWRANGAADARIVSYAPQKIRAEIAAASETLIGSSITAWPGWRLTVDGKPAELLSFDHAFLGFFVPTGKHVAELRYMPAGFVYGASISALTVAALAGFALLRRRRRRIRDAAPQ